MNAEHRRRLRTRARHAVHRDGRRARWLSALLVLVCVVVSLRAALESALPDVVHDRIANRLASMGFEGAQFRVTSVRWNAIRITDIQLTEELGADAVEIGFSDPAELVLGHILTATVHGARWTVPLDPRAIAESTPVRLLRTEGVGPAAVPPAIQLVGMHVTLEREDAEPVTLDGDVDVSAEGARGAVVVRSPLGEHALDFHVSRDASGLTLVSSIVPAATPDVSPFVVSLAIAEGAATSVTWDAAGALPAELLGLVLSEISLGSDVSVTTRGAAHAIGARWALEDVELDFDAARARVPSLKADLEDVSAELHARGWLGDGLDVQLDPRSRVRIGHIDTPEARLDRVELTPVIRISGVASAPAATSGEALASASVHAAGDSHLSFETLELGEGAGETHFARAELTIAPRDEAPFLVIESGVGLASIGFSGSAHRVGGALVGRGVRVTGALTAELAADAVRVSMPLHLDVGRLRQLDSETSLTTAHFDLPLSWDEEGALSVAGRVRARGMSWSDVALGAVTGSIRLVGDHLTLDWTGDATETAPFELRASIGLATGRTVVDVAAPMSEVGAGDALHRVLVEAVGIEVIGPASCEVRVEPRAVGGGSARLTLAGASVRRVRGRGAGSDVRGTFALGSIDPPLSVERDRVTFGMLTLGDLVRTRDGSASVRFDGSGSIEVEDAVARVGGGRVRLAPFRFAPDDLDVDLDLTLEGIRMDRLVALLAEDRATASGLLDGNVALHLFLGDEPRVVLGEGRLAARGRGSLHIPGTAVAELAPTDLEQLSDGQWIRERVLAALSDFEYRRLVFEVVDENGTRHLRAHVAGHGATTPQELELNVHVDDVQTLIDESMRVLPHGPRAHAPT